MMVAMDEDSKVPVLVKALDRLKSCADGQQKKICLTSEECKAVCAYIWWLTDRCAHAKAKEVPDEVE